MDSISQYPQYIVPDAKDLLNLGVGQPSKVLLQKYWDTLILKIMELKNIVDPQILQYGSIEGFPKYRQAIANFITTQTNDTECNQENIFMTNGVSQGLDILVKLLVRNGYKTIYVQNPTYFLAIDIFKDYDIKVVGVTTIDELEYKLKAYEHKSLFYIIPFHQNPTGLCMTIDEINEIANLCSEYDMYVLSDETYQSLHFAEIKQTNYSLCNYHYKIISLGTFSKILGPSLRLGWIYTKNTGILNKLTKCGFMDSGGGVNPLVGQIVVNLLDDKSNVINEILNETRSFLKENCDALCSVLDNFSEYFEYVKPGGGYFVWVKCKKFKADKFLEVCRKNKLQFHVGSRFSPNGKFDDYFRLSFSYYAKDDIISLNEKLTDSINMFLLNHKIKVLVQGADGKLGKIICHELESSDIFTLHHKILRESCFPDLGDVGSKNVFVDVSSVDGTKQLLQKLLHENIKSPLVIGTTGDLPYDLINEYAKYAPVMISSNFSIGVSTVNKLLELLIPDYWKAEIDETHHIHKKDAPSGTAKTFAKLIENKVISDIKIESHREGEVIGLHKILLKNDSEEITIIHNALDRNLFAKGCLKCIEWILTQKNGVYFKMS
jgi:2-aminoadipate transaminase